MIDSTRTRWRRSGGLAALVAAIGLLVALRTTGGSTASHPVALPPGLAPATGESSTAAAGPDPAATSPGAPPPSTTSPTSPAARQVDGDVTQTPYGPVQIELVLTGNRIVDVRALQLPSAASRSRRLAALAAPQLRTEVLAAQSAQVDTVSGATYTSQGYAESVQYAIDHE